MTLPARHREPRNGVKSMLIEHDGDYSATHGDLVLLVTYMWIPKCVHT